VGPRRRPKVDEALAAGEHAFVNENSDNDLLSQPGTTAPQPALRQRARLKRRQAMLEKDGIHGLFDLTDLARPRPQPPQFSRSGTNQSQPTRHIGFPGRRLATHSGRPHAATVPWANVSFL
jgi:hypothetical protein